jgi:hypothetical protein
MGLITFGTEESRRAGARSPFPPEIFAGLTTAPVESTEKKSRISITFGDPSAPLSSMSGLVSVNGESDVGGIGEGIGQGVGIVAGVAVAIFIGRQLLKK